MKDRHEEKVGYQGPGSLHFVDHFGATIVKIGQLVQKILKKYARRYNLIQTFDAYEYS